MSKRIEWIDIFKALTIILMVIGHSTGLFNNYIYQFHMAAFFFISGYTAYLTKKRVVETILNKFYSLILPLITMFFTMLIVVTALHKMNRYSMLFDGDFIGFKKGIIEFFVRGNIYINWLGATWFLGCLFGVFIIQHIILNICKKRVNIMYCLLSMSLACIGYFMKSNEIQINIFIINLDLIFIAQLYFCMGMVFREYDVFKKIFKNIYCKITIGVGSLLILWYFGNINPITVDYPSRRFGFIITDALVAMNGIVIVYILSRIISKVRVDKVKQMLTSIGKSTLGILFFHFLMFKLSYIILAIFKVVPWSYLSTFVPTAEIGAKYWWLSTIISLIGSYILWEFINKWKVYNILLGQDKEFFKSIYTKVEQKISRPRTQTSMEKDESIKSKTVVTHIITFIHDNKVMVLLGGILVILISAPMMIQGIIINDELQSRFWIMKGTKSFFNHYINLYTNQGRALGAITTTISMFFNFISSNEVIFRLFNIMGIIINIGLFSYLIFRIFNKKGFAVFSALSILVFLPISFEHTLPNAFVNLFATPFSLFLISLILFIRYLEKSDNKSLIISCILLFISFTIYEIFIMLTPLYLLLILYKTPRERINLKYICHKLAFPFMTSLIYLVLYFILRRIFPSAYNGNQIGFTIKGMLEIMRQLLLSSMPGYFLFNHKYRYLLSINTIGSYQLSGATLEDFKNLFIYLLNNFLNMRTMLILFLYMLINFNLLQTQENSIISKKRYSLGIGVIISGIVSATLLTVPNAISKMYQGYVNEQNFIALPVTYFSYFFVIFTLSYIIWEMAKRFNKKYVCVIIVLIMGIYSFLIQGMNDTFAQVQNKDYERLLKIERIFETQVLNKLNKTSILCSDLYIQKNALAVHNGYWTQYAEIKGLNIEMSSEDIGQAIILEYPNDEYFLIRANEQIVILSEQNLQDKTITIRLDDKDLYRGIKLRSTMMDNGFYVYALTVQNDTMTQVDVDNALEKMGDIAGKTLDTAQKIRGYYPDGWVENISEFKIRSGDLGIIKLSGYYPDEITKPLISQIYINDVLIKEYKIQESNFNIEVETEPNKIVNIKINNKFESSKDSQDVRKLSFVLIDMEGK